MQLHEDSLVAQCLKSDKSSRSNLNVTQLSAPLSSEWPVCKSTLLKKQLDSPILFGLAKSSKKRALFYTVLAIERYANHIVSGKVGSANYFSKLFVNFRKMDFLENHSKNY